MFKLIEYRNLFLTIEVSLAMFKSQRTETSPLLLTVARLKRVKMSPPLFLLLLFLTFLAPTVAISASGGKIAPPQLPEHNFPIMRR